MNGDMLAVTRSRGLAVLAHNVREAVTRHDIQYQMSALDELINAARDMRVVVEAGRLDEPGSYPDLVHDCRTEEQR